MDIRITDDHHQLHGTLSDNPTARDLAAMLPLTLALRDFAATEKIADLPRRLDTSSAPVAHTGRPGDITYYAPWGNLAVFYRTGPNANGLIHIGTLSPLDPATLATLDGQITISPDTE